MLWDGISRAYIDVPPSLKGTTKGLCGNYNAKQKDDFLTPEGDIETDVNAFANKWKVKSSCDDVPIGDDQSKYPCSLFSQRKANAELLCSNLISDVFKGLYLYL